MKFHVLWLILTLTFNLSTFAQEEADEAPDLSNLEEVSEETSEPMSDEMNPDVELNAGSTVKLKENLDNQSKRLTLKEAIETGLRKNSLQKSREYEREKIELDWKDNYDAFWFPQLSLKLQTEETLVDNLYTDIQDNNGTSKTPNGFIGLEFENYTLFNWGKDYLDYQNNKQTYKRAKKSLEERRRNLRFGIIGQYFNLSRAKRVLQIKRSQLRHSSFIYRLAKEKITLKKINGQHYLQAKAEFLRSHAEFQDALFDVTEQENALAQVLGDELSTSYTTAEQLKYVPLTTNRSESYKYALKQSPEYLAAKTNLENANRSFQKALKDNMPLPKFDIKLGAFKHNLSDAGAYDTMGQDDGSRNVELVASINMTWKIFGSGGLFNSRVQERSYLNKRVAEIEFTEARRNTSTLVNTYHRKIRYLEKQVEANSAFVKNARKTFDRTLDNYIGGKTTFPNMKMVLDSLILSETTYETSKYQHMLVKLKLAYIMGIDDFPGESFEKMVLK
jgi:outer membrane protein TolC